MSGFANPVGQCDQMIWSKSSPKCSPKSSHGKISQIWAKLLPNLVTRLARVRSQLKNGSVPIVPKQRQMKHQLRLVGQGALVQWIERLETELWVLILAITKWIFLQAFFYSYSFFFFIFFTMVLFTTPESCLMQGRSSKTRSLQMFLDVLFKRVWGSSFDANCPIFTPQVSIDAVKTQSTSSDIQRHLAVGITAKTTSRSILL